MDEIDARQIAMERERAERALDAVRLDVAATIPVGVNLHPPPVNLHIDAAPGGGMWVTDDQGSAYGETILAESELVTLVSVADCAQTVVMEWTWGTWPVCPFHDVGLHAGVEKGQAIWECGADGGHVVAPVGRLPSRA
jgi:hypothetical protein